MKIIEYMGGDWYGKLETFIKSPLFSALQKRLALEMQRDKSILVPVIDCAFNPFKECRVEDLKVVFINDIPMRDSKANDGLAFSVSNENAEIHKDAKAFIEGVEEEMYDGFMLARDYNLKRLAKQGVLLLNASPTMSFAEGNWINHAEIWRPFMNYVITDLAKNHTGLVFILCGKNVRNFAKIILPTKNYLLTCTHPRDAEHFAMTWDSGGVFQITNTILSQNSNTVITW